MLYKAILKTENNTKYAAYSSYKNVANAVGM